MRFVVILSALAAITFTAAAIPAANDIAVFDALEAAGPAGTFTAVRNEGRVLLFPSSIGEIEVHADACVTAKRGTKAAAVLGHFAVSAVTEAGSSAVA